MLNTKFTRTVSVSVVFITRDINSVLAPLISTKLRFLVGERLFLSVIVLVELFPLCLYLLPEWFGIFVPVFLLVSTKSVSVLWILMTVIVLVMMVLLEICLPE